MEVVLKLLTLLLGLFFVAMFVFGFYVKRKSRAMQGREFKALREGVVYFYSERCGACKRMKPEVEKLRKRVRVLEVDVFSQEGSALAREYGVMATPTTFVVKDGIIKKVFVGLVKGERILQEV
ncbi:MAG: thioredoxin [Aquificota bacterium]|nr:MAG: thioredoxin [Aquificota bacterium]